MNNDLKNVVRHAIAMVQDEDGWIHPLRQVLEVSEETATWRPAEGVANILEIVAHLQPYVDDVVRMLRADPAVEHEDWGGAAGAGWDAWRSRTLQSLSDLEAEVHKLSVADLEAAPATGGSPRWQTLLDISIHNAYHAGQIVKLTQAYVAARSMAMA